VCAMVTLNTVKPRPSHPHQTNSFVDVLTTLAAINVRRVAMVLCRKSGDPIERTPSSSVNHVNGKITSEN